MLHFTGKPPFSFERFLTACADLVPEQEIEILRGIAEGTFSGDDSAVLHTWLNFDRCLRNELVKVRAGRKHVDPVKYLRGEDYCPHPGLAHLAIAAHRTPLPVEGERMLDEARWLKLDELSFGHYFDFDFLVIYALKLLILLRWQKFTEADKSALLENIFRKEGL